MTFYPPPLFLSPFMLIAFIFPCGGSLYFQSKVLENDAKTEECVSCSDSFMRLVSSPFYVPLRFELFRHFTRILITDFLFLSGNAFKARVYLLDNRIAARVLISSLFLLLLSLS